MLVRKQDLCVLIFYYLGYSRIRNLVFRVQGKPAATFVAFHDIPNEVDASFRAKLCFLKQYTNVISLEDYYAGRLSCKRINVVITFDDGYKSWISRAVPALKQLGLPATFFVSSGFLGLSKDDEAEFIRSKLKTSQKTTGGLNGEDLKKMAEEGYTIGGHTCNHVNLAEIHDQSEVRREILEDKQRLESIIGKGIQYFAYPFGAYHNPRMDLIEILKAVGYQGAVTTEAGLNTGGPNAYLLSRELTDVGMSEAVFRARVYGNYAGVKFLKNRAW